MKPFRLAAFTFALGLALTLGLSNALDAQAVVTPPQSVTTTAGATATFNLVASGTSLTYQWQKDGTAMAGATSASLTITNVQPTNTGIYTAVVSSGATTASASAIL